MIEILVIVNGVRYYLTGSGKDPISLQFSISDINDITRSNSSYSKTIKLPDNKNNREVFGFIQNINSSGTILNPNKRIKTYILVDSIVAIEGYLQIKKITPDLRNNNSYYECVIYGDNANFGVEIGDKFITDDDYSHYDHIYGTTSIIDSWGSTYDSGYFYPLIDSGSNWEYKEINGSSYSIRGAGAGTRYTTYYNQLEVRDFKTAVYVKTIWDKIFQSAGYTYQSDFLNSNKFKNLLIPFNGSVMPTSRKFIYDNSFAVGLFGTFSNFILDTPVVSNGPNIGFTSSLSHSIKFDNKFPPYSDPLGAFQTGYSATGSYWINKTGMNLQTGFVLDFDADFEFSSPLPKDSNNQVSVGPSYSFSNQFAGRPLYQDYQDYLQIFRSMNPTTGVSDPFFDQDGKQQYACPIFNGSTKMDLWGPQCIRTILGTVSSNGYTRNKTNFRLVRYTTDILNGGSGTQSNTQLIGARPNEKFKVVLTRTYGGMTGLTGFRTVTSVTTINTTTYLALNIDPAVFPGASVDFNGVLPKNMKKKDFISNIKNMFNLYFEKSKDIDNCLIIEPRDDYYNSGEEEDWTLKLDESKPISESVIAETQNKYTNFTYKIDSDYYNQDYFQKTGNVFGQYNFIMDNDFLTGTKKIELMFSPTPMMNIIGSPDIIIPQIVKVNGNGSSTDGVGTHFDFNTRILTRGTIGTVSTAGSQIMFANKIMKYYPYAGHLDHPITPTYDINFGEVTNIYNGGAFGWGSYSIGLTTDTLFNTYYSKMLYEYSNPGSRIITCSMILNVNDINKFRFNKKIYLKIDGAYGFYKVLKISGWDPTNPYKPCQVELLKTIFTNVIKNKNSDTGSIYSDGASEYNVDEQTPPIYIPTNPPILNGFSSGNNTLRSKDTIVLGRNNMVGSSGLFIGSDSLVNAPNSIISGIGTFVQDSNNILSIGDGNTICNNNNSVILGSGNQLLDGCNVVIGSNNDIGTYSGVIMIGNGLSASQSNMTYINNTTLIIGGSTSNIIISGSVSQDNIKVGVNEIAYGDVIGLTSSGNLTFDPINNNIQSSNNSQILTSIQSSIIGGYQNQIGTSSNSGILSSYFSNIVLSNKSVIIGGGVSNLNSSDNSSIITSYNSNVCGGVYSSIIGGNNNLIYGSVNSGILSGFNNSISSESASVITGGGNNQINSSIQSAIIGGYQNKIDSSNNSSIIGGYQNQIGTSSNSGIFGGCNNTIESICYSKNNNIIGGILNTISGSYIYNAFITGYHNKISTDNGGSSNISSSIIGGGSNIIYNSNSSIINSSQSRINDSSIVSIISSDCSHINGNVSNSVIVGGFFNTLTQSTTKSAIIGGMYNSISGSFNSSIIGGRNNKMLSPILYSSIIGGKDNTMCDTSYSTIINGVNAYMCGSYHSLISGSGSYIKSSRTSTIFGSNNTIKNSTIGYSNFISGISNRIISATSAGPGMNSNSIIGGVSNEIVNSSSAVSKTIDSSIIGGRNNTLLDVTHSSILGGVGNLINDYNSGIFGGSTNTIIGGGLNCIRFGYNNIINSGCNNNLYNSSNSSIIGGYLNCVSTSRSSIVIGGEHNNVSSGYQSYRNSISGGNYNSIVGDYTFDNIISGGISNIIMTQSYSSTINGGDFNTIKSTQKSSILGGFQNQINTSCQSAIIGGYLNCVSTSRSSIVIGGEHNNVSSGYQSYRNSIIGGYQNQIGTSSNSGIFGGRNSIINGCISHNNLITGGFCNMIGLASSYSYNNLIVGGCCNTLSSGNYGFIYNSSIIGGFCNTSGRCNSSIIGGACNNTGVGKYSSIVGGRRNSITGNFYSVGIINGDNNTISGFLRSSNFSVIIGGNNNTLTGVSASVILGSSNKTLDLSINSKNNNTLVTNFILTGSMSTINGSTYSVGWNGTASFGTQVGTFVNGILINIV